MPIRFRCAYCNQLMGISTRKAGTVVRCPKCAGEIIVPVPEGMQSAEPPEPPEPPGPAGPQVFESQNFEQAFNTVSSVKDEAPAPLETAEPPAEIPAPMPAPPPATPPRRLGLFLSVPMLIVSLGVIVLLLILMFVLGLIIGIQSRPAPEAKSAVGSRLAPSPLAMRCDRQEANSKPFACASGLCVLQA